MRECSRSGKAPLYLQLREIIREKVESGAYPPGTAIPSENTLAETYGIHRLSVRSAISALIYEGLLKSVQGKGVFVVGPKDERSLETIGGFRQTMTELGHEPSTRIITRGVRAAGECYALVLGIAPEDEVFYVKRVCCADGKPYSLEELYIPLGVLPSLGHSDLSLFSMYELYAFHGIRICEVRQSLELEQLDPGEARLLGVEPTDAVLKFQGISRDQRGRIIEFARTYTRADRCAFNVHYQKE